MALCAPWHIHYATVASTMDTAATLAAAGAPHGSLVTATAQTRGRGRQGKAWVTAAGTSFAGTYILREGTGPHLPLVVSLAVHKALSAINPQAAPHLAIKWPNDILLDGSKLAGILVEQKGAGLALVGIGINLLPASPAQMSDISGTPASLFGSIQVPQTSASPAPNLRSTCVQPPQTSLNLSFPLGVVPQLSACVAAHCALYQGHGWSALAAGYSGLCATIGQTITWKKTPTTEITGKVNGLSQDGALMLQDGNGVSHLIHAGEIIAQATVA